VALSEVPYRPVCHNGRFYSLIKHYSAQAKIFGYRSHQSLEGQELIKIAIRKYLFDSALVIPQEHVI
jgi:hypothetical protein